MIWLNYSMNSVTYGLWEYSSGTAMLWTCQLNMQRQLEVKTITGNAITAVCTNSTLAFWISLNMFNVFTPFQAKAINLHKEFHFIFFDICQSRETMGLHTFVGWSVKLLLWLCRSMQEWQPWVHVKHMLLVTCTQLSFLQARFFRYFYIQNCVTPVGSRVESMLSDRLPFLPTHPCPQLRLPC